MFGDPSSPLTWEILSRLAGASTSSSGEARPFYVQRAGPGGEEPRVDEDEQFFFADPLGSASAASLSVCSRDTASERLLRMLEKYGNRNDGGRVSLAELCAWLGMETSDVLEVGDWLCNNSAGCAGGRAVVKLFNTAHQQYEFAFKENLQASILNVLNSSNYCSFEDEQARSSPTEKVAQEFNISAEDAKVLIAGIDIEHGSHACNSRLETRVISTLRRVTSPVLLESIFGASVTNDELVATVRNLCERGELPGTLSNTNGSVYTPILYTRRQRTIVDTFFQANGYITFAKCATIGLSRSQIESFVKESFVSVRALFPLTFMTFSPTITGLQPRAVLMTGSIIDTERVCRPIANIVETAILNNSCCNVKACLPDESFEAVVDVEMLMTEMLPVAMAESNLKSFRAGYQIINTSVAMFFSEAMVKDCQSMLNPLIEEHSKLRAKHCIENDLEMKTDGNLVPLVKVANAIGSKYPDLALLDAERDIVVNGRCWEAEEGQFDGVLIEFCRRKLLSDEFKRKCNRAVKAEVSLLKSVRHGLSVSSRTGGAAHRENVGASFESSFRNLCHLLQLYYKSIESLGLKAQGVEGGDCIKAKELEVDLLRGLGSCLAKLITEFCIFKSEDDTETGALHFNMSKKGDADYASASTVDYPVFELKCSQSGGDVLKHLRKSFPGSAGIMLSEMWGAIGSNEGLSGFIQFMTDSCLSLVGVPFSLLDRKTEKKLVAHRREGLLHRLEVSRNEEEVASCTVLLLLQQIKNISIYGTDLARSGLVLLKGDKKIPAAVTEDIHNLFDGDSTLLESVKKYAAAKNSKSLAGLLKG